MTGQIANGSPTKANLWAGVMTAALGLMALFWLIPEFVTGATDTSKSLTPGFMPRVAAWCMVLLGISVAFSALRVVMGKQTAIEEESEENEDLSFGRDEIVNTLVLIGLSIVYVIALSMLGFVLPSTVLLIFLIYKTGFRKKLVLTIIAIAFPITLELLLWHVLKVPLPQFPLINF